ncbi:MULTISPECIES: class II aldolase/adducin family protein [unclassified Caballeronia]|uniref:class II aldolase/adducin family protein n=1 Tax=unclassified Caballeronia TaxID=2646786 RepID=UPI00285F9D3D|nr:MULTISPECIES: class II aldolase/adducin family protein [unclassified Caballeronia]MDR5818601.1 class II aldolase/adducin family protein [Caballeronia sp. LZ033]MDR5838049.1 class II aldolase/adducin family protein [Caballeronia sp. LZ034LL]
MATHGYSQEEWQVRCDLAALYRVIGHFRWTDMIFTHISARVPGSDHHFLINRYGVLFDEMRASDLVRIDSEGRPVEPGARDDPERYRVNPAGFTIHSAIHMARHDVACVVHTHTAAGAGVSAQKRGLLPISQHALKYYGHLAYHDYEGIALDLAERDRLVNDLGSHNAMILRNHGLLTCGKSIPEAFQEMYFLERACEIQLRALAGGGELNWPSEKVCEVTASQYRRDESEGITRMQWEAALRMIEGGARTDYRS